MKRHLFNFRFWALGGWFTFYALGIAIGGSALIGAGTSIYEGAQTQNAIKNQQQQLASLQYQPIDINSLITTAQQQAAANATNSLSLERQLTPGVYASNQELQKQVASNLAGEGNLPADVRNAATQGSLAAAGRSGNLGGGSAVPQTAATLGTTATNLDQLYQSNATSLAAANPAPVSGLDPGSIASAMIANNANQNQFNIAKAGGQASLTQSLGQSEAGTAAGVGGALSGALSNYAGLTALSNLKGSGTTQLPSYLQTQANPTIQVPTGTLYGNPVGTSASLVTP